MFNKLQSKKPIHILNPSQWMNFGWLTMVPVSYFIHPYACALAIAIYIYKYFEVDCWRYEFYDDCVIERKGVFSVTRESVNYFRIKSVMVDEPFWMRLLGLSIVKVITSEQFKQEIIFQAVGNGEGIQSFLQENARIERMNMGIRDFDVFNTHN
jgi:membrane protein YdbS with pleckstrin-like domain